MANTTWIEVADDAVKIGIGSLITGVFAWMVALRNSRSDREKLVLQRRTEMLIANVENLEALFRSLTDLMFVVRKYDFYNAERTGSPRSLGKVSEYERDIDKACENLQSKLADSFRVASHLLLLNELKCETATSAFMTAVAEAMNAVDVSKEPIYDDNLRRLVGVADDLRTKMNIAFGEVFQHSRK